MKRIRGEQIHAAVGSYLKRRHYTESDIGFKKELRLTLDPENLALHGTMSSECSSNSTFSYSSICGDVTACDQQFTRLKIFLHEAVEPFRSELAVILYPMFVHVYLELLCNGQKTPAHKFFSRHHIMFNEEREFKPVLDALSQMYNKEDVINSREIKQFREHKYFVQFTQEALQYILRYLKSDDNMLLLQIFNNHIKIKVIDRDLNVLELKEDRMVDGHAFPSPPCTPDNKVIRNEVTLSSLQQCIKKVREGPSSPTSICYYSVQNTHQGMCSATISSDKQLLSTCFEDGAIRMWNLTPKKFKPIPQLVNVSRVNLAGDVMEDIEERNRCDGESEGITLTGHSGAVYKSCFTPDSKYLLSGSEDKTVRLWRLDSRRNVVVYKGHNYPVWDLDVSTLGTHFVSCSHDRTTKLWCLDRLFPLRNFVGHTLDVDCVKFHPNCNYIATGSSDKTVRLWSLQDGKTVRLFQGHRGTVHSLAFSPDGQYLASAGEDKRIKVWELKNGTVLKDLRGHTDNIHTLDFNRDGTLLASGGMDGVVRVWDIRRGCHLSNSTSEGHASPELLGAFPTKPAAVHCVRYAQCNLLFAVGAVQA